MQRKKHVPRDKIPKSISSTSVVSAKQARELALRDFCRSELYGYCAAKTAADLSLTVAEAGKVAATVDLKLTFGASEEVLWENKVSRKRVFVDPEHGEDVAVASQMDLSRAATATTATTASAAKESADDTDTSFQRVSKHSASLEPLLSSKRRKKERTQVGFDIPANCRKYSLYEPLHALWVSYFAQMAANDNADVAANRLLKADWHGAVFTVVRCVTHPERVGLTGIVIMETENTIHMITVKDCLVRIPKARTLFECTVPLTQSKQARFVINGSTCCVRPHERTVRKWKADPSAVDI
ncbi:nuclear ribonuclease P subunit Rpp29 (Pop4) [Andalucia godoyi]|uniref:Nuclear ribonuclease P subunit Rpp29 (Pop4) n=1 Tax=Andalucia godoyi TaxID=505711 RepID=A0A8K0AHY7_ANDGO|nr:nuclear ribonuclease P subunit Rpp29 (Pop4) [Andalucia godoyi]|eukprot:ANDGO_02773.mRNA.1 nuclear ribonuclease P subunit Rpp29 (Pop4)